MRASAVRGVRAIALSAALVAAMSLAGCATSAPATDVDVETEAPAEQPAAEAEAEAEAPVEQSPADTETETEAPVEQPAEDVTSLADRTIDTPYYTVVVPESWRDALAYEYDDAYTVDEQSKGTDAELGIGYTTVIRNTATDESFSVTMFTDAWGPQGQFMCEKAGPSTAMPGNYVAVVKGLTQPFNGWESIPQDEKDAMTAQMEEYASWVTVK